MSQRMVIGLLMEPRSLGGFDAISDKYTFFAYSPYCDDCQGVSARIDSGELVIDYLVPDSSIYQPDLMYALPKKNIVAQSSGVPLTFFHALACVSFAVEGALDDDIVAIDVNGVLSKGALMWDYGTGAPKWSVDDQSSDSFSVEVGSYSLDDDSSVQLNSDQGYLMMIPQTLDSGAEVMLTLRSGQRHSLLIPVNSEWVAGGRYNYVVSLNEDESSFIFSSTEISNCYIINPTSGEATVVQIPIEERINDFWKIYSGDNKNKITNKSDTTDFQAALVWEDFDEKATFTYRILYDESGNMAARLTVPADCQEGNLVFSIQEIDSSDDLWSWHLWFTDYNPDAIAKVNRSSIVKDVDSVYINVGYPGAVHRYRDGADSSMMVWSSGIYEDKFIMDRNIGQRDAYITGYGAGTVYYQFGRKDPFPGKAGIYYDGATSPGVRKSSSYKFWESVEYVDDLLISGSSSSENWCVETAARDTSCVWFDAYLLLDGYDEGKSIFDPSPLGWRVPVAATWSGVGDIANFVDKYNYSYSGRRDEDASGALSQETEMGYLWSCTPLDSETGYALRFSKCAIDELYEIYFSNGLPVRAIEE